MTAQPFFFNIDVLSMTLIIFTNLISVLLFKRISYSNFYTLQKGNFLWLVYYHFFLISEKSSSTGVFVPKILSCTVALQFFSFKLIIVPWNDSREPFLTVTRSPGAKTLRRITVMSGSGLGVTSNKSKF